jgi:hypothetical protein
MISFGLGQNGIWYEMVSYAFDLPPAYLIGVLIDLILSSSIILQQPI